MAKKSGTSSHTHKTSSCKPCKGGLRPEVWLVYATCIGMVALDLSAEVPFVTASEEAELHASLNNARQYFSYNVTPQGVLSHVVPLLVVGLLVSLLYRVVTEWKLLDLLQLCMAVGGGAYFWFKVRPIELALAGMPADAWVELRANLTTVFLGHVLLLALLLFAMVLHLFASPPTHSDRIELIALWMSAGMLLTDLSFDIPVMLSAHNDMQAAFTNNTIHLHTFLHPCFIPSLFVFIGVLAVGRFVKHRQAHDGVVLALFGTAVVAYGVFVEPYELGMLKAGVPNRESLTIIGSGHLALVLVIGLTTYFSLSAQRNIDRLAHKAKSA